MSAAPSAAGVRFDKDGHVARVTLDRPGSMNALDAAAEQALEEVWTAIERDADVRAVVLTGAGERAFCAGADMKTSRSTSGLEYWATARPGGFGGIALRETLDVPVIARVNGFALGGGFEMVLGCDIVVASDTASFGLPEPRVGRLPLDGGMTLLARQIAFRPAMGILLTGRRVPAREALALGLVNEVVAPADLDDAVARWVADILACAPLCVRTIKAAARRTAHLSAREAQAQRLPALVTALQSEDSQEGVAAFRDKRAPVWKGR
jgi:crotonobetainyl-CoA hydratase